MKKLYILAIFIALSPVSNAQLSPVVTSWLINTTGATGHAGILSNVQVVQYSANYVYISCTDIPAYHIGPWPGDPNVPSNQSFVYKIPLNAQRNTGIATALGLGHCGVWSNGVSIFNSSDGMSYNNLGYWHRNAYFFEGSSFDTCLGHAE